MPPTPAYRLLREPLPPPMAPVLDVRQRAVVEHAGGPLLVLAGPGTGKTTTLVEAVVERVRRGSRPEQVLALTFSRKAATELRERITARLGTTTTSPAAWTFHSFCYAVVRAYDDDPGSVVDPVRLLSGPEQEVHVRELLEGSVDLGTVAWPEPLRACLHTRGFAEEVRAVFSRARALGMEPVDLRRVARGARRGDWAAVAAFFDEYLAILDAERAMDYAELVHRARSVLSRPEVLAAFRERYDVVFVDEYQDTDPAQEGVLALLAGQGRDLVVVGDPDQSIYAFRGADVTGILRFPERFPTRDGDPSPVVTLDVSRRSGPRLVEISRSVARRLPAPGLPAEVVRAHRALRAVRPDVDDRRQVAEVRLYRSEPAEAAGIADVLRRARLDDGVPWSSMAVLVRSGVRSIPILRRALVAAGVPVEVAGDEVPLGHEPAVHPLLLALRCADDRAQLDPESARRLLLSPLGGADATLPRALGRALREAERAAGAVQPRPSAILVRDAVAEPELLAPVDERVARPARRVGNLIRRARVLLETGSTPEEALWAIWAGTRWPHELERQSFAGGPGGRAADRDLDSVVALFESVARAERRRGRRGVRALLDELEAQEIPADTLAERAVRGDAVRLLTAHRSKGLEWDLVVVASVQDGRWPDTRRRGTLLEAERIEADAIGEPLSRAALLAEERRLFYVAITRARARLVVTAVDSPDDEGLRPSPFLAEIPVPTVSASDRPVRPLTMAALVADLRATASDAAVAEPVRELAVQRLAVLASERGENGEPLVPTAHPDAWWGLADVTEGRHPVRPDDEPVPMSGSSLATLLGCPLRWFLDHEVHAAAATTAAQGIGGIVHALADEVARDATPAELDELLRRLDTVWPQLAFEARWESEHQREVARQAIARYLVWHGADRGREFVASEHRFDVVVGPVRLRGSMDRVERDADGRYVVSDFKTSKNPPGPREIDEHPQLGVYQHAVRHGALSELVGEPAEVAPGGAELVQLRREARAGGPLVQAQPPLAPDDAGLTWVDVRLAQAVEHIVTEDFPPAPGDSCGYCAFRRCCPAVPEGRQVVE